MPGGFSIVIATPTVRATLMAPYVRSLFDLQTVCAARDIEVKLLLLANVSSIDFARNVLCSQFLYQTQCSHMLFIDDDMGFNPEELAQMFDWRDTEVVAAMCPKRSIDWTRIKQAVLAHPDIEPAKLAQLGGDYKGMFYLPDNAPTMTVGPQPMEVDAIGTGIMMISRACLMALLAGGTIPTTTSHSHLTPGHPMHNFFSTTKEHGEDHNFCHSVRRNGGKVLGCPWLTVTHTGQYDFVGDIKGIAEFS
jgi:hypothetical protein